MIDNATLASDYRAAADLIRERGLAKRAFEDTSGAQCTVGALATIQYERHETTRTNMCTDLDPFSTLNKLLGIETNPQAPWIDISRWNDRDTTTAEDVIGLFTQAAEKLEADLP